MTADSTYINQVDFDLYGIVGLRFNNPTDDDIRKVSKLLGPFKAVLQRPPDITITYKKNWDIGEVTYLGLNTAAFNNDGFYILSSGREPLKVKIPFDKIGDKCEIICEQGIVGIPLLHYIIGLTFLRKGYLPVHASAFSYNSSGSMIIGWSKGGKTEALFSFINNGAEFIGDETVFLSSDGKEIFGIPVPVSIWEWQFKEISDLMPPLSLQQIFLFKGIHFYDLILRAMKKLGLKNTSIVKILDSALPTLKKQLNIRVAPDIVFKGRVKWQKHSVDRIILAVSRSSYKTELTETDPEDIVSRMISSNLYELEAFYNYYSTFKFAFPGVKNEFLENVPNLYEELTPRALSGIPCYKLVHPYPVSFKKIFKEMEPVIRTNKQQTTKVEV